MSWWRSQLLAYNIMFGRDYELGPCPGCSSLADHLDAAALHLGHRDVTLILLSRAPIERLLAYKRRMDWRLPYVSTSGTDFPFDVGLAVTKEQAREIPEIAAMLGAPPEWLQEGLGETGRREARGRPPREPELDCVRSRERYPADTEGCRRLRAAIVAQGRVPGLIGGPRYQKVLVGALRRARRLTRFNLVAPLPFNWNVDRRR